MSKLRTLIVGFGNVASGMQQDTKMARYFDYASHASVLADHPDFDWLGVVDPDVLAQQDARETWQIPHVGGDLADIARQVNPDVAVIATPPGQRAETVEQLPGVQAILLEKPLSAPGGEDDGLRLAEFSGKRAVPVLVNYWRRADRRFQALAAGGMEEMIGRVQAVFGLYGNGLANNASHMIDFLRMLAGEVSRVQATGPVVSAQVSPVPGDVNLPFTLTLESGAPAAFTPIAFDAYREVSLDIWGDKGRMTFFQEGLSVQIHARTENRGVADEWEINSDQGTTLECTVADSLYRMYDNLAAGARGEGWAWSPLSSALINQKIIQRIGQSASEGGRRLDLD